MALGAQRRDILRHVVGRGARLLLVGVVVGLAASLAATRVLAAFLYGVGARDALTFAAVAALVVAVAWLASYLPARRAARVEPMVALRTE
jgi:ABC-type antimicrobial peptide transport system permease subunit